MLFMQLLPWARVPRAGRRGRLFFLFMDKKARKI